MAVETEIKTILTIETGKSEVTLGNMRETVSSLKDKLKDLEVGSEDYQDTLKQLQVAQNAVKDAMYGTTASVDDLNKSANGLSDSYNSLVHRMAALKNEFRSTNDEVKRAQLGAQIKGINDQLKAMDALQGNFQRNVGNYTESVKKAFVSLKEGVDNFGKAAGVSVKGVKDGFEAVSKTPLLAVMGLLVNLFLKARDAMKDNEEAMKGINAAVEVFKPLGNFLSAVLEKIGTFLGDIFTKVSAFIGSNGLIQQVIQGIAGVGNAIAEFIIAPFRGIVAAIKVFQEEGIKGFRNAAKAFANEAKQGWTFKQNFQAGQQIADNLLNGFKDRKPKAKETGKDMAKTLLEGIAEEMAKEIDALAKETADALSDAINKSLAEDENAQKIARDRASRLLEGLDKYTERRLELNDIETKSDRQKEENAYNIQEEANKRRLELLRRFEQEAMQSGDLTAAFDYQQKAADLEVEIDMDAKRRKKKLREQDIEDFKTTMSAAVSFTSGILSSLASIYEADDKASAASLKKAKAMKVASAIMTTLQGAVAAYVSGVESGIPAPGNIILGAAQAATVTAAGMANVAQIKSTKTDGSGTVSVPSVQAPSIPTTINTTRSLTTASEEDRLNFMAYDQRVTLVMSELEAKQNQRRVQLAEASF